MELKRDLSTEALGFNQGCGHADICSKKVKDWPAWKKEVLDALFLKYSYTEEEYD